MEEIKSSWPRCPLCGSEVERWYFNEDTAVCPVHGRIKLHVLEKLLETDEKEESLLEHAEKQMTATEGNL